MSAIFHSWGWQPPAHWTRIRTVDMHTGGEPLRIPVAGLPEIKGDSVLAERRYFREHYDHLRTGLMFEPRGHADMYGAILSESSTPEGDFDVFFIHNEGYSTMCGHAILALTKFVLETGLLPRQPTVTFNVPAGTVYAAARWEGNTVVESTFRNVPSYLYLRDETVAVPGLGTIRFDVAFGGAFYAFVDAASLSCGLTPDDYQQLIDYGRRIKRAVMADFPIVHPGEEDLSFLYGTIFTGPPEDPAHHSRNVCIFAEGEVDRSATGSGVSARAGLHYARGELALHQPITIESILGSTMTVEAIQAVDFHGFPAVVPQVTGTAYFAGENNFWFDPADPWREGFIFR